MSNDDSNESREDMAECGACRAVIPIDSTRCPECNVSFSGVADDEMGECGACNSLVPLDSKSCPQCGIGFVLDDLTSALSGWMKEEGMSVHDIFGEVDSDSDGSLTADEVKEALKGRNLAFLGANELDRFIAQIDLNRDGVISYPELAAAISMPWVAPEEPTVLEPSDSGEGDSEGGESDDSDIPVDSDDTAEEDEEESPQYTERVLKRVMKTYGITDKEGFLTHASTFDKDGNNFLKEPELTEAAKSWKSGSEEADEVAEEEAEEVTEEEVVEEAEEVAEEEAEEVAEEVTAEEVVEGAEEEAEEEDDGGDLPFKDIDSD
ncbi:MAG: EF-hand domain-containing protein, partial [Candidatus Thermoplasmatota archaeon]|nr:EF-hand domain-containing protein [Candidatus Thermoplasmatota archaeon]